MGITLIAPPIVRLIQHFTAPRPQQTLVCGCCGDAMLSGDATRIGSGNYCSRADCLTEANETWAL